MITSLKVYVNTEEGVTAKLLITVVSLNTDTAVSCKYS